MNGAIEEHREENTEDIPLMQEEKELSLTQEEKELSLTHEEKELSLTQEEKDIRLTQEEKELSLTQEEKDIRLTQEEINQFIEADSGDDLFGDYNDDYINPHSQTENEIMSELNYETDNVVIVKDDIPKLKLESCNNEKKSENETETGTGMCPIRGNLAADGVFTNEHEKMKIIVDSREIANSQVFVN